MLTLELPLGLGFTAANVVSEVLPSGSASDGRIRKGDRVTHVDGVDVRGGRRAMVDALEESRARHNQPVVTLRVEHAHGEPHRPPPCHTPTHSFRQRFVSKAVRSVEHHSILGLFEHLSHA